MSNVSKIFSDLLEDASDTQALPEEKRLAENDYERDGRTGLPRAFEQMPAESGGQSTLLARSAVFTLNRRGRRRNLKDVDVQSRDHSGIAITYTGEELQQSEQEVWMACLRLFKKQGLSIGDTMYVYSDDFLKDMQRPCNKEQRKKLGEQLIRLALGSFIFTKHEPDLLNGVDGFKKDGRGSVQRLIDYAWDTEKRMHAICLTQATAFLFERMTYVDWAKHLSLDGRSQSGLLQKLNTYVSSDKDGWNQKITYSDLKLLLGVDYDVRSDKAFRERIRLALIELEKAGEISQVRMKKMGQDFTFHWKRVGYKQPDLLGFDK